MRVFDIDGKRVLVITTEEEMFLRELTTKIINAWNQIKELFAKGVGFCNSVALWFEEQSEMPESIDMKPFANIRHTKIRKLQSQVQMNKPKRIFARSCL